MCFYVVIFLKLCFVFWLSLCSRFSGHAPGACFPVSPGKLAVTLQPFLWTCVLVVFSRLPGPSETLCFWVVVFVEVSVGRLILHVFLRRLFCDASAS